MSYYVHDLDPIAFHFFGIPFPWYWLVYFIGYFFVLLSGKYLIAKLRLRLKFEYFQNYLMFGFLWMLIASKLFYILLYNPQFYLQNPSKILMFWEGGMSFHGALLGVLVWSIYYAKSKRIEAWQLSDLLVTSLPLVLFFGRLANFVNGELAGRVSNVAWAVIFPKLYDFNPRHPSQLYQAILEGLLLFVFMWGKRSDLNQSARQTIRFVFFYGLARFVGEFFRQPDQQIGFILNLSVGQIYCAIMMFAAFIVFVKKA